MKRTPGWITVLLLALTGTTFSGAVYLIAPEPTPQCRDRIISVPPTHRAQGTPCRPDQSVHYMRDFNGDIIIVCTCPGHLAPNSIQLVPVPGVVSEPIDPDVELDEDEVEPEEPRGTYL